MSLLYSKLQGHDLSVRVKRYLFDTISSHCSSWAHASTTLGPLWGLQKSSCVLETLHLLLTMPKTTYPRYSRALLQDNWGIHVMPQLSGGFQCSLICETIPNNPVKHCAQPHNSSPFIHLIHSASLDFVAMILLFLFSFSPY